MPANPQKVALRTEEVYRAIAEHAKGHRNGLTYAEIGERTGLVPSVVLTHVRKLAEEGRVTTTPGVNRSVKLVRGKRKRRKK